MTQRNYIDFKLFLTQSAGGEGACQVSLLPTPEVGETILPVTIPAEALPKPEELAPLASKIITNSRLVEVGKKLANCILPEGPIRELFRSAVRNLGNHGGLRLRLVIASYPLKQFPWEYVYINLLDGPDSMNGFLLLDSRISMVRHEPLPYPHPVVAPSQEDITDLRMVIAGAVPEGLPALRLEDEVDNIRQAIQIVKVEGVRINSKVLMDATPQDLFHSLAAPGSAYILHFAGHGLTEVKQDWFNQGVEKTEGAILLLKDKTTRSEARVGADDLAGLLQGAGVRLAVIGACHSGARDGRYPWEGVAGALMARDIPAVIAMQYEVFDQHMIDFSKMFYYSLASGLSLDEAVALGRKAMYRVTEDSDLVDVEWGVPVLYSRLPSGMIFPERMERAGAAAETLRTFVKQSIDLIDEGGVVTGLSIQSGVAGDFKVSEHVKVVKGELIGAKIDKTKGSVEVEQHLGTVSGDVKGVIIKDKNRSSRP